ncbi:sulfotransferase domain-containing protein [uncultured Roseobacter sp.]|uniref:sulfotransferase domain-containing protein n=1 Tax=uncultured Roseobacter sp. TaxID=114847 RepID=UPI002629DF38|nr:sulfotransferase domain-containing protein [uncultured Roseobacter sp.]
MTVRSDLRMPDFVVIGAAKSGTTSLYRLLQQHPDVFVPDAKEPEFFARDEKYAAGLESYAENFKDARPDQITGEFSTIYTLSPFFPDAAARMAEHAPQAKLIYVMRQPVKRAYSFYVQILKNYQNVTNDLSVHRSFEEFIDPERHANAAPRDMVFSQANAHLPDTPELCLAGSDYLAQIDAWCAHFPRTQILFLKFEDFVTDRPGTLRQITDFLGIAPLSSEVFDKQGVTRNVAANHFRRRGHERALHRMRSKLGGLWALRLLLPAGLRDKLRTRVAAQAKDDQLHIPPQPEKATEEQLTARFRPQTAKLAALTGLDLSDWWN